MGSEFSGKGGKMVPCRCEFEGDNGETVRFVFAVGPDGEAEVVESKPLPKPYTPSPLELTVLNAVADVQAAYQHLRMPPCVEPWDAARSILGFLSAVENIRAAANRLTK